MDPEIDPVWLRAELARRKLSHREFAELCHLSRVHTSRFLAGSMPLGELGRIKVARGVAALGLDRQAVHA